MAPSSRSLRVRGPALALGLALCIGGPVVVEGPALALAAAPADKPAKAQLATLVDDALSEPFLAEAQVGVSIVDLETGEALVERGAELPLNPASNVKLVTTAAALGILGPAHRYSTGVYHDEGALSGTTIRGELYLQGSGDPALVTANLYELAGKLRARGIEKITGGITVDASTFDRDELPPGFDQKQELASFRAPGGATVVNFDTFEVHVRPGAVGKAPFAGVEPPVAGVALTVTATTEAGGKRELLADYEAKDDHVELELRGTLGVDSGATSFRYPIDDPSRYAGELLALVLERQGIKVGRKKIKTGKVPRKAELLAAHHSDPLGVLVRSVNKFSNNFMAEQILKTIDADPGPATFEGALQRVREHLQARGVPTEGLKLGNGSGLYDTNRVSAGQFTALLSSVYADERIRPDYMASLAIMGVDGTTRSRLEDTPHAGWVRVKTGTLDGVSSLSGYAGAPGRKPIAFSILFNGIRKWDNGRAHKVQDRIVELLARYAAGQPLTGKLE
ncbi:MAG: D-alanyl-D-alanine carboxypeptidase/D-alanyl-D-alanine-endopeptidase [Myxococcales bacterium]|nr:D-alanyl-D-alanine carboxypeptidase/D-alanyl-D-alanine-endopeptidase [Myxococcales bacterium]MCB9712375.1 D-alanyl-D-alanine carboxypeptidase/D-alanyl-D-alanine-endopeptidase [Myxococcales bacterium]